MELSSTEIKRILPHRYPFLLIDKVVDYVPGESASAIKNVTINEPFFQGHFPEEPVMPGVLLIEAMAQTGAVAILSHPDYAGKTAYFGGINNARFRSKVVPGDTLELSVEIIKRKGPVGIGKGTAKVGGRIVAQAELTFAVGA